MTDLSSGQSLASRFSLIRRLGRGGMGDVWLARDEDLDAEVVVKIVPVDAGTPQVALLRQECRNARRLSHPNIVKVFDFHQDPRASFISMEYVEGESLCRLRGGSTSEIVEAVAPLLDALEYAHAEGVIHRDLKCANVMIDRAGRPRLSDFGISGLSIGPGPSDLQLSGGGSGHFASPQQRRGDPPSVADDVYGLGMMMRDLLGPGRSLGAGLDRLLADMTAEVPADRPADMAIVRARLLDQEPEGKVSTTPPNVEKTQIRLTPPPKVPPVRQAEVPKSDSRFGTPSDGRLGPSLWWLTGTAFLLLAVAVFAVFALLPKWVEQRRDVVDSDPAPEAIESEPMSSPETPDVQQAATVSETLESGSRIAPETAEEVAREAGDVAAESEPAAEAKPAAMALEAPPSTASAAPRNKAFAEAMSAGLAALKDTSFEAARESFERALSLVPESAEAADGLARAQQELRLAGIREHRERAEVLETRERWHEARREYEAALALDPSLRFAIEGRARAEQRARLDDRLRYHIANPDRLVDDRVLAEARSLLAEAETLRPVTPTLESQIESLRRVVRTAETPVSIVLESDNLTEVLVYRVGRLGKFERHELELRPGLYTVVGSREGYRDVRRKLQVESGGVSQPLVVRCEEKI